MLLVRLLVLLLEACHVVGHMDTEDVLPVHVSVEALALAVISGETPLRVRDVQSSVNSSLEGSENLKQDIEPSVKVTEISWIVFSVISSGSLNHNFHGIVKNMFVILTIKMEKRNNELYLGSSGSPGETHIQTGTEGSGCAILILHAVHGSVNVVIALVHGVQRELLEDTSGQQETGAVGSGVVGQTNLDSVPDVTHS